MSYKPSANKTLYLSIVVPLYNEEESVEKLVSRIIDVGANFKFVYEIILVDDGSTDNTWQSIEKLKSSTPNLRGIKLRRNYGQTNAMVAGFDHAAGEIIVTLDGDLQNDPSDIPMLLQKIEEGYDIVSGWRKDRKDHFSRVLPSKIANWIISFTIGVKLHDYGCSLKAYRTECIKSLKAYGDMHRFFPALASMTGARIAEVPVKHYPRKFGVSKYGFDRIFKVISDIFMIKLLIRFVSKPLKGFFLFSVPFLAMAGFFSTLGVVAYLLNWTEGKSFFFMLLSIMAMIAGVHVIFMGIIGELVVGNSDLKQTRMIEKTKKVIQKRGAR